jgi:hypothetical protein
MVIRSIACWTTDCFGGAGSTYVGLACRTRSGGAAPPCAALCPPRSGAPSFIVEFVSNLGVSVLGVVGLIGLFYTVVSVIEKIEDALNHIWHV